MRVNRDHSELGRGILVDEEALSAVEERVEGSTVGWHRDVHPQHELADRLTNGTVASDRVSLDYVPRRGVDVDLHAAAGTS